MTRPRWKGRAVLKWFYRNRGLIGELFFALLISGFIMIVGRCSINRNDQSFEGTRLRGIYDDSGGASSLVLYEKGGVVQGREFSDQRQARYFAEALR